VSVYVCECVSVCVESQVVWRLAPHSTTHSICVAGGGTRAAVSTGLRPDIPITVGAQ
jgi:hypothetical protein